MNETHSTSALPSLTHALFCAYLAETLPEAVAYEAIDRRVLLMERRGYPLSKTFAQQLIRQMKHADRTAYDTYSEIICAMEKLL